MSMQWYIIHTYSGFEKKVKESLESRVAAFNLQDKIGRVLIPTEEVVEVRGGKKTVASRILGDLTEAEDLVQDLFLFIQRKCAIFDSSKSTARSWIVQMAYHRALDRRRYLKARQFYAEASVEENAVHLVGTPTSESDYSAEVVFGRNGLEKILSSLSRDQRETLRLHFFEGYTFTEISEKLGQPLGNVRHYYYRALQKLRQQMFANDPQGSTVVLNR